MTTLSDYSPNISVSPKPKVSPLGCFNEVCRKRSMALGILNEERAVTVGVILLVWMVVRHDILEASGFQPLGYSFEALL